MQFFRSGCVIHFPVIVSPLEFCCFGSSPACNCLQSVCLSVLALLMASLSRFFYKDKFVNAFPWYIFMATCSASNRHLICVTRSMILGMPPIALHKFTSI